MTLDGLYADTSKALHKDGNWYILDKEQFKEAAKKYNYPHQSVIYHQCVNHWKQDNNSGMWIQPGTLRVSESEFEIPCNHCAGTVPEDLKGLWLLHNFDSIQSRGS